MLFHHNSVPVTIQNSGFTLTLRLQQSINGPRPIHNARRYVRVLELGSSPQMFQSLLVDSCVRIPQSVDVLGISRLPASPDPHSDLGFRNPEQQIVVPREERTPLRLELECSRSIGVVLRLVADVRLRRVGPVVGGRIEELVMDPI